MTDEERMLVDRAAHLLARPRHGAHPPYNDVVLARQILKRLVKAHDSKSKALDVSE